MNQINITAYKKFTTISLLLTLALLLVSCSAKKKNPTDPFEPLNRKIFAFNKTFDKVILKPTAKVYKKVLPSFVQKGVLNVFGNLREVPTIVNSLLQADVKNAGNSFSRLLVNTTIGILGLFDVATGVNIEDNKQDMGMTLAKWGIKKSAYFILPVLGPSTLRDTLGYTFDYFVLTPYPYIKPPIVRFSINTTHVIVLRANLLDAEHILDSVAVDPYVMERDAFFQFRQARINGKLASSTADQLSDDSDDDDFYVEE